MTEQQTNLSTFYKGWDVYHGHLVRAIDRRTGARPGSDLSRLAGVPGALDTARPGLYLSRRALGQALRTLAPVGHLACNRARLAPWRRTLLHAWYAQFSSARPLTGQPVTVPSPSHAGQPTAAKTREGAGRLREPLPSPHLYCGNEQNRLSGRWSTPGTIAR